MNRRQCRSSVIRSAVVSALAASLAAQVAHAADERIGGSHENDHQTASPIKHVIVIVGENRTFDHIFATYQPPPGEHVDNLLSKGIVNIDGSPGPNYGSAGQNSALNSGAYSLAPGGKTPYNQTSNQLQAPGTSFSLTAPTVIEKVTPTSEPTVTSMPLRTSVLKPAIETVNS